jgi:hypothetical protein
MGVALDLQSFTVTAPGAAGAACAAVGGGLDSLNIRNARMGTDILTLAMWTNAQAVGFTQMLVTSGHDFVRNYRQRNLALDPANKIPRGFPLHFKPQDALTITQAGSAVALDQETVHMLNWYEDLPGVEGNFINVAELRRRGVQMLTVEDTTTATAAGYSGARNINQAADLFKADTEYAIVGGVIGANCGALAVQGVDFGNLHVGMPGASTMADDMRDWFMMLSEFHDVPCIPVFSSANRASVVITNVTNELLIAVPFSLTLVQLSPRRAAGADGKPLNMPAV